jgi:hypothetical protein
MLSVAVAVLSARADELRLILVRAALAVGGSVLAMLTRALLHIGEGCVLYRGRCDDKANQHCLRSRTAVARTTAALRLSRMREECEQQR